MSRINKKNVAIIGGGISGLSAAYYLSKHAGYDVTVFESQERLGGHAHTFTYQGVKLDTTVVAFHETAYPNFVKLIRELGVYEDTRVFRQDLCFHSDRGIDYMVTYNPLHVLRSPRILYRTAMALKKLSRAVVLHRKNPEIASMNFYDFLTLAGMSEHEIRYLVLPMIHMFVALSPAEIRDMPAGFLVDHLYQHKLLHHSSLTAWRNWEHGTETYISKLAAAIHGTILTEAPVKSVATLGYGRIAIERDQHPDAIFDAVILATSPASTLRLFKNPTDLEKRVLGPWEYATLGMHIHKDHSVLPPKRAHWGFWNPYTDTAQDKCAATYVVSKLHSKLDKDVVVSWAPIQPIAASKLLYAKDVEISRYSRAALETHKDMPLLNEQKHGIYYCGAHFGLGWHEAGVASALDVVARFIRDQEWKNEPHTAAHAAGL